MKENERNTEALAMEEQELLSELILKKVSEYHNLPNGLVPQFQSLRDEESIGVFTLQGAVYLEKDILGGFTAQFPFMLVYRSIPSSNGQRINSQELLDGLGKWMEQTGISAEGRVIEKLERTTTTVLHASYDNGAQDYKCGINLIYRKGD